MDLLDAAIFEEAVPHEYFRWLREHEPVHWNPGRPERERAPGIIDPEQRGFWVVTRHADVAAVSKSWELFSSARGTALNSDLRPHELPLFQQQMIHMDPPRHTQLRNLINRGFKPSTIAKLDERIRCLAREIIDQVAPKGECDFVAEVAAELPLLVLAELLGVPSEDRHLLFEWTNRLIGLDDPDFGSPYEAQAALLELIRYFGALGERRRTEPGDDLVSVLVHEEIEGEKISSIEFNMMCFLLVVAGNETTRNAISGGVQALCEFSDQRDRLLADQALLKPAVEEMIRWHSPVMQFRRTATRNTEIAGQAIRENDKVVIYYGAANRDGGVFDRADEFDVGRTPNPHLGFGIGSHFCLGANLARAEMRILMEELLWRLPDLEVTGPVERLRSNFINGIKRMPVRFTPVA